MDFMPVDLSIHTKIVLAIATILSIALLSFTTAVSYQSGRWFDQSAQEKLAVATKVVLADVDNKFGKMTRDINILAEDEGLIHEVALITDRAPHTVEEDHREIAKKLAIRFKKISDTRQGFHLMRLYDANAHLIAFYDKDQRLAGWFGDSEYFSGLKGNDRLLFDQRLPSTVPIRYTSSLSDQFDIGFGAYANRLEIVAHQPVYEKIDTEGTNHLVGMIVVDTFFDNAYAEEMSDFLNLQINFFLGKASVVGTTKEYITLPETAYQALQSLHVTDRQYYTIPIEHSTNIEGREYYEALFPFLQNGKIVGASSLLLSKAYSTTEKINALLLLSEIGLFTLFVGIVIAFFFSRVLTRKLEQTNQSLQLEKHIAVAAKMEAENTAKAKSEFLANMSHEIRTPLNGVMGMIDLALGADLSGKARDYLLQAKRSSRILLRVIHDILDFSKIDGGKLSLESLDFRLSDLMNDTVSQFRQELLRQEIVLRVSPLPNDLGNPSCHL